MQNHNDFARDKILRFLYKKHATGRGPKGVAVGIRDIQKEMKTFNLKGNEVTSNLDYLLQKGWVRSVIEHRTFTTPRGTTQQAEKINYKISDIGIDKLEDASIFNRRDAFSGTNITNLNGVTVVGAGNVVNTNLTDLAKALNILEQKVKYSNELESETKLNIIADIGSIQSQLAKPKPERKIIQELWSNIERIAAVGGLIDLVAMIGNLVR